MGIEQAFVGDTPVLAENLEHMAGCSTPDSTLPGDRADEFGSLISGAAGDR